MFGKIVKSEKHFKLCKKCNAYVEIVLAFFASLSAKC